MTGTQDCCQQPLGVEGCRKVGSRMAATMAYIGWPCCDYGIHCLPMPLLHSLVFSLPMPTWFAATTQAPPVSPCP